MAWVVKCAASWVVECSGVCNVATVLVAHRDSVQLCFMLQSGLHVFIGCAHFNVCLLQNGAPPACFVAHTTAPSALKTLYTSTHTNMHARIHNHLHSWGPSVRTNSHPPTCAAEGPMCLRVCWFHVPCASNLTINCLNEHVVGSSLFAHVLIFLTSSTAFTCLVPKTWRSIAWMKV